MKKHILAIFLTLAFFSTLLGGCKGDSKSPDATPAAATEKVQYQCPMCKDQLFDKPGKCPSCEMDLVKVTKS